jgi:syntaxin-binding protein 5
MDSKNDFSVFSLETKAQLTGYSPPGLVTAMHSDPMLDYVMLGTQTGEIFAFDLDRENMAPFKIPNLWREKNPRALASPVLSLQFHPRDIGKLLIGYAEGAVVYSFKQAAPSNFFHYVLQRGAPGGDSDPSTMQKDRAPKLTQAVWHPTGTFILTGHEDSSLVYWDPKDGRIVMARTIQDTNIDKPGSGSASLGSTPGTFSLKEPIFKIAWCANQDPDDTAVLIAGGAPMNMPTKGLTLFELGRTPNYATSSWQILASHLESPRRQRILPTPPNAEVVDFCLIPRSSPHFAGAQDPIAVLALLSSGELVSLSFPSGIPISPTNQLHPSLTFVHPFINRFSLSTVNREQWLGMTENRQHGPLILKGGAPAKRPMKRFELRNIIHTSHADGTIRLWDIGHGDELENDAVLQLDVSRAVGRQDSVEITSTSLASATSELAAGLRSGELVVFRWGRNKAPGVEPPPPSGNKPGQLTNILERQDPALIEGLHPYTLFDAQNGPVTAVKLSDVGFVAAGFEGGRIVVIDLRGPAIIYQAAVSDFIKQDKRGSFRRHSNSSASVPKAEWPVTMEFSVMTLESDDYSSILLHVGTNLGHVATFKLLPESGGRYGVQFAGATNVDDKVLLVHPLNAETGKPAYASQHAVAGLRNGAKVNGVLVVVTGTGARIFKAPVAKGASKGWDEFLCEAAAVTRPENSINERGPGQGYALVCLFNDGSVRAYSLPALKEISSQRVSRIIPTDKLRDAAITGTGDVLAWLGPAELALLNVWGTGLDLTRSKDLLWNKDAIIPPRPTISNFQWVSGTQFVTPTDMDILIGGPDRPPSKRMLMQARADEAQARADARAGKAPANGQNQDEGYWAYMQRQLNERTEKLGIVGDNMERLESNSRGWVEDVNKFVGQQKRNLLGAAVKSKFGF